MKKVASILALFTSIIALAQEPLEKKEKTPIESKNKSFLIAKTKVGISQLELYNDFFINGTMTQVDLLISNKLSNKFRIEYGLGFSQFTGNNVSNDKYVSIKNNNIRVPLNILHNQEIKKDFSMVYGLGLYGTYLAKTDIQGYYEGGNVGLNVGWSFFIGTTFKISEKFDFRILMEVQRDITKVEKANNVEIKERMNTLIGLNYIYKF